MNILIVILIVLVGYPIFMMGVYIFSKGIFDQKEFSEINLRNKRARSRIKDSITQS